MSPRSRRYGGGGLRAPKEVNKRTCPVCGAKKGEVCFKLTKKAFFELRLTHTTHQRNRRETPPDLRPMVLDETYDR